MKYNISSNLIKLITYTNILQQWPTLFFIDLKLEKNFKIVQGTIVVEVKNWNVYRSTIYERLSVKCLDTHKKLSLVIKRRYRETTGCLENKSYSVILRRVIISSKL